MFERDYDTIKKQCEKESEKNIKIICYYLQKNKNIKLDVTNKYKVIDVKKCLLIK